MAGLGGVIYALTLGPDSGWLSAPVLIAAVIGVVCLVLLVPAERRPAAPMLRLGYSPAQAGAALIPESVVFLLLAPVSGALAARVGPRWLMTGGIVFVAGGFGWLATAQPGQGYAASILPGVLLWGLGIGLAVTPVVPVLIGATGSRGYAGALAGGYRPAMNGCPPPVPAMTTTEES